MAARAQFLMVARRPEAGPAVLEAITSAREAGSDEALVSASSARQWLSAAWISCAGSACWRPPALAEAHGNVRAILRADVNLGVLLDARADFEALRIILRGASRPPRTMVCKGRQPPSTTTWRGGTGGEPASRGAGANQAGSRARDYR